MGARTVMPFIEFLYFEHYNVPNAAVTGTTSTAQTLANQEELGVNVEVLQTNLRIYSLAEQEGYEELKRVALRKLVVAARGSLEGLITAESVAERVAGMEKDVQDWRNIATRMEKHVQDWRNRATMLEERLQYEEAISAEKVQQLEATITRMKESETTNVVNQQSGVDICQLRGSARNVQQLGFDYEQGQLIKKMEKRITDTEKKLQDMENELEACRTVKSEVSALVELQELEAVNAGETRQSEGYAGRIEELKRKVQLLESKVRWIKARMHDGPPLYSFDQTWDPFPI